MKGLAVVALMAIATAAAAQPKPQVFTGARIVPVTAPEIERGVIVIEGGKIVTVGAEGAVTIPAGADVHDASGNVILPGLVDTHSHIGSPSGADRSSPIQPDVRVLDSVNVRDAGIQKAQAGGITTVNVMPGSGYLLSGQTLYLKLRDGNTIDDLLIRSADGSIAGGMKMANGTNPLDAPPFPQTRAKSAALLREQLVKAQEYRDKVKKAKGDAAKMPARDLAMEGLGEVLDGKRVVHFHTHRHDDILTVLRLAKEFGFRVVLQHVTEGFRVADEIAKAGVPASIILIDSPGGKLETMEMNFRNGAILDKAGVAVAIHTDDGITDSRLFLRSGGLAIRGGMSRQKALEALTIAGAKMLDLDSRVGSLEKGKDADLVILSGDPFSTYTHVLETWVDGTKVFDRSVAADRLFATGGYGASRDQHMHLACIGEGE